MADKSKLLFIDTNILLDFYRCRNDAGLSLLQHLDLIQHSVIMTYQIEMEFKKHRQNVILESINQLKPPQQISRPGMFSDAKAYKALQRDLENAGKRVKALKSRLKQVFLNPTTHDEVYKVAQRLFLKADEITLSRDKAVRFKIRRLAWKRFVLGYPPRKQNDTSIGDAINWEWLIHCAASFNAEIVIVSRDSDYGVSMEDESFLNDWLMQEFKSRVKTKRKIVLRTRLAEALKAFEVKVTEEEEEAEDKLVRDSSATTESTLNELWSQIMLKVKSISGFLHMYLNNTRPFAFDGKIFTIAFASEYRDDLALVDNTKNRGILKNALHEIGFADAEVRFIALP